MTLQCFSAADVPLKDRVAVFLEVYAAIENVEVELTSDMPLIGDAAIRSLPNVTIVQANCVPCISRRTRRHVVDGKSDLVLSVFTNGKASYSRNGGEPEFYEPGEAYLGRNDRPCEHALSGKPGFIDIAIPRALMGPGIADLDRATGAKLPPTPELVLLTNYVATLTREIGALSPDAAARCSSHILDLATMAVGATRDAQEVAEARGVRAVRLRAVKGDIAANLLRPDLSVATVARRQGVSPQYVRALFNGEGTTFADHVRAERLTLAHEILCDPARQGRRISDIAFEAGFGDLSYFNRSFRQRYGMTPSDVRGTASDCEEEDGKP